MTPADLAAARAIGLRLALLLVADRHQVTLKALCGQTREKRLWRAREDAYASLRRLLGMSYPQIGRAMGGRDHTTVMAGAKKHAAEVAKHERVIGRLREIGAIQ